MGLIALDATAAVPFPRRLFQALADRETDGGADSSVWRELRIRFEGGGCLLDLADLSRDELASFKAGVLALSTAVAGQREFGGFETSGIVASADAILNFLNRQ